VAFPLQSFKRSEKIIRLKALVRLINMHKNKMSLFNSIWFKFWLTIALSAPVIIWSFIDEIKNFHVVKITFQLEVWVLVIFVSIMYATIIWTFAKESLDELRSGIPGICTIIILVSTLFLLNVILSQKNYPNLLFFNMASVIDLLFINYMIIKSTLNRLSDDNFILKKLPDSAQLKLGEEIKTVSSAALHKGDIISVNSGDSVPCDGVIIDGVSRVREPFWSGTYYEIKGQAAVVSAGSKCIDNNITLKVVHSGKELFINKVAQIFNNSLKGSSNLQNSTKKIGVYLFVFTILIATIQFIFSYYFVKDDVYHAIEKSTTLLAIACFYTSYIVVQLCVFLSLRRLTSQGIFVNHRDAFENARKINAVVFDRTGTLTEGRFGVIDIVAFSHRLTKDEIIKFAASVEKTYGNPIAKAIVEFSHEVFSVVSFQTIENQGVSGFVEGKNVKVVNVNYLIEKGIKYDTRKHNEMREGGKTVVYVVIENELFGAILLTDVIRAESRDLIKKLKKREIKTILLTADTKDAARWMANELQLDNYLAEVQKKNGPVKIKEFQSSGYHVGATGNGLKDVELLKQADVGFALGSATDITTATADIMHFYKDPRELLQVIAMSQLTYKKIIQNISWISVYTVSTAVIAMGIFTNWKIVITPALGALLALLGTLVVILNSRFYHRVKK
jgi:Cu2+-exporting ATPase